MGVHDFHGDLSGYDQRQILHDGRTECERRAEDVPFALSHLDPPTFSRALDRAIEWQTFGGPSARELKISHAEHEVLETLWLVALSMARSGRATFAGMNP